MNSVWYAAVEKLSGAALPLEAAEARRMNPLVLAYMGDTIHDLFIRTTLAVRGDGLVNCLNRKAVRHVNAHGQAVAVQDMMEGLTEEEQDVFRWGRNAKSATSPKHADIQEYRKATGFEAVLGYLYITGRTERLAELLTKAAAAVKEEETCQRQP
ncbi:Mini-ribonuclease 3 [Gehongia tenuis]|nr:ribonuclease III domain-containing protein [Gehongia tenuis]